MKENEKKRKKIKKKVNSELSRSERWAGIQLLTKYVDCFATNVGQQGYWRTPTNSSSPGHEKTESDRNLLQRLGRARRFSQEKRRYLSIFRRLSEITTRDVYPLPRIDDAISRLEGCRYFTIMDLEVGYWHVGVRKEDTEKTASITTDGLYQFRVMPFGLTNAPVTFQRMMDILLSGLKWVTYLLYLDDIVVSTLLRSQRGRLITRPI